MNEDPEFLRALAEEHYHDKEKRHALFPTTISSLTPGSEEIESCGMQSRGARDIHTIASLTPDEIRLCCWKDCALYTPRKPRGIKPFGKISIFDAVYCLWYPHRARAQDVMLESFFCKFFGVLTDSLSFRQLGDFHSRLCERVRSQQAEIKDKEPRVRGPSYEPPVPSGNYELRPTFEKVFIVVDKDPWKEAGVLVVCKDEETAEALGLGTDPDDRRHTELGDDAGTMCAFRVKLKRAIEAIVSEDEERRVAWTADSKTYQEYCGQYAYKYGSDGVL